MNEARMIGRMVVVVGFMLWRGECGIKVLGG